MSVENVFKEIDERLKADPAKAKDIDGTFRFNVTETGAGTWVVDTRADLLRTTSLLSDVALDKYSFVRDSYLQFRRAAIGREGEIGRDRFRDGRSWVNDLTNRSGPTRSGTSDDDAAGSDSLAPSLLEGDPMPRPGPGFNDGTMPAPLNFQD